jgi:SAM-dependent methyltransferase
MQDRLILGIIEDAERRRRPARANRSSRLTLDRRLRRRGNRIGPAVADSTLAPTLLSTRARQGPARRRETMTDIVQSHNLKAQSVWNAPGGRYDDISRSIADAIEHAVERLQPTAGEHILDVATGTGWGSRVIAQRFPGVKVTGADIAEHMLEHARSVAQLQGLDIDYRHADAEKLPFADGAFDGAISTFGVMFVGKPEAAAAELARVVKKGGRLVLTTWKHDSNLFEMFGVMKKFMPAPPQPPPPSPFAWGRRERVLELLGAHFELAFEAGTNTFRYGSGEEAWNLWVNHYGPSRSLAASLDDTRRDAFRHDMIAWHEIFKSEMGYAQPREYLVTGGIRK